MQRLLIPTPKSSIQDFSLKVNYFLNAERIQINFLKYDPEPVYYSWPLGQT